MEHCGEKTDTENWQTYGKRKTHNCPNSAKDFFSYLHSNSIYPHGQHFYTKKKYSWLGNASLPTEFSRRLSPLPPRCSPLSFDDVDSRTPPALHETGAETSSPPFCPPNCTLFSFCSHRPQTTRGKNSSSLSFASRRSGRKYPSQNRICARGLRTPPAFLAPPPSLVQSPPLSLLLSPSAKWRHVEALAVSEWLAFSFSLGGRQTLLH